MINVSGTETCKTAHLNVVINLLELSGVDNLSVSYIPPVVPLDVVETHLRRVGDNVRLFFPEARVKQHCLLKAWEVYE